uniref:Uncharacterized protein n=1 Tax=Knipowitschia caucasica TaxID=637954 RepID=A0AAV2L7N8_KNICA
MKASIPTVLQAQAALSLYLELSYRTLQWQNDHLLTSVTKCDGEIQINSCQSGGPRGEALRRWGVGRFIAASLGLVMQSYVQY